MKRWNILVVWLGLLVTCGSVQAQASSLALGGDDFLPVERAFQYTLEPQEDGSVIVHWDIEPGYYLYRKRFELSGEAEPLASVAYPDGEVIHDDYFGDSEVYFHQASLVVHPGNARHMTLTWQGCAEAGLCYPPQTATVDLPGGDSASVGDQTPPTSASADSGGAEDLSLAAGLSERSLLLNLAVFFGLGLLLVFTPCVLPMIPILSAVVVGNEAGRGRAFQLSLVFVVAMAVTYAALGVAAAMAGAGLQGALQTPPFIGALAALFVLLALSMFGLYDLQLPAFVRDRLARLSERQKGGHLLGAGAMGFFSALLASPCMTAPLAGALIYIADSGDLLLGGLVLLALGLGMGAPLILLATIGSGFMPRPGGWMNTIKAVFGVLLLGTAIVFVDRVVPASITLALWGALSVAVGVSIWRLAGSTTGGHRLAQALSVVMALWGVLMLTGAAAGGDDPTQPLRPLAAVASSGAATARADHLSFESIKSSQDLQAALGQAEEAGQWTLVDFYADWCVACKEIEEEVFGDPNVQQALANVSRLRADVTANDVTDRALMTSLGIVGPPTLLLFGPDGEEVRTHRIVGELSAEDFLERLRAAHHTQSGGDA